ncbi:helix-turn-helix domain-containing protein [Ligilactobacillus equi]|uniref:Xre family DNA-binding protein n=2 Tax=Ligilactobacillus equi TaxID=137357 RepID=A0A0R1TTC1_9LACO|nr:S24 family peptidase [Ligilactobacillus equi]ETA75131.1 putative Xre family DNA-binding protein [Ligilactobacillus equi DPC 6820]KRL84544.1 Xre family DNA-binding protein [Ligilactobacillus equi DSM 15833 = JCM 10991]
MRSSDQVIDLIIDIAKQKHISITELSKRVGMAKSGVSRYFNKTRKFPLSRTAAFADALGVRPDYLINDDEVDLGPVTDFVKVPVIGKIACGSPITAQENIESYIEVPRDAAHRNVIYLEAKGHSMEPTIPDGSLVLINLQPTVENGEIAAVLMNDQEDATLKKVKKQGNSLVLYPLNPDYDVIVPEKDDNVRILGKAVQVTLNL